MTSVDAIRQAAERADTLHDKIAADLKGFGGHLECTVCGRTQPLGNVGRKLANGWPKCCDLTMRWITSRQEDERCEVCRHPWDEHNGMGDCLHLDGRTATGYCAAHQNRENE